MPNYTKAVQILVLNQWVKLGYIANCPSPIYYLFKKLFIPEKVDAISSSASRLFLVSCFPFTLNRGHWNFPANFTFAASGSDQRRWSSMKMTAFTTVSVNDMETKKGRAQDILHRNTSISLSRMCLFYRLFFQASAWISDSESFLCSTPCVFEKPTSQTSIIAEWGHRR